MTADDILDGLETRILGRTVHAYQTLGSTNDTATRLAAAGAPEGTLVTTEAQTRGKGRLGRGWTTPAGMNLTVSLILRPPGLSADLGLLPPLVALGVVRGLGARFPGLRDQLQVKWPNDVLTLDGGRKLAGVLCEASFSGDGRLRWVVAGIGLNVNARPPEAPHAAALMDLTGGPLDRVATLHAVLGGLEAVYLRYRGGERAGLLADWRRVAPMLGQPVSYRIGPDGASESAVALDLDGQGRLLVRRDSDGATVPLAAADVTLRKPES